MTKDNNSINKEFTTETKIGIGVLAGAVIAGALSAIYLYDSAMGHQYRKSMKKWMTSIRGDIEQQLKRLKKVDKDVYFTIVDDVVSRYQEMDEVDAEELVVFAKELKEHYKTLQNAMEQAEKKKARTKKTSPRKKTASNTASKSRSKSRSTKTQKAKKSASKK